MACVQQAGWRATGGDAEVAVQNPSPLALRAAAVAVDRAEGAIALAGGRGTSHAAVLWCAYEGLQHGVHHAAVDLGRLVGVQSNVAP